MYNIAIKQLNITLLFLSILIPITSSSQETQWEIGAGFGIIDFQLYPGSTQTKTYLLPLPYFTLHSEYLEIDRGIRGLLPSNSHWRLDISADFAFPVDSKDSVLRRNMPDLDAAIQIGPSLEYSLTGSHNEAEELRLELPLRTAITVDKDHQGNEGWLLEPRLVYEKRRIGKSGLYTKARAGLRYATKDYHAYYYDVDPVYETVERQNYQSDKGYSGLVIDLRATWRQSDMLFWGILRYQNISHAVFDNSPLVEDDNYYFVGAGISWIITGNI